MAASYRKLEPDILMMQSTEDGPWLDASDCVHRAQGRRVLAPFGSNHVWLYSSDAYPRAAKAMAENCLGRLLSA